MRRLQSILEEGRDRGARPTIAGGPRKPATGFRLLGPARRRVRARDAPPFARRPCCSSSPPCSRRRALGACGNKHDEITEGETEGVYLDLGELKYQVQISRQLNPADREDQGYLSASRPRSASWPPTRRGYGIFIRVQNVTDEPHQAAEEFEIRDTQGERVRAARASGPRTSSPTGRSRSPPTRSSRTRTRRRRENTIQGSLLLFKIPYANLENRPLELEIVDPADSDSDGDASTSTSSARRRSSRRGAARRA